VLPSHSGEVVVMRVAGEAINEEVIPIVEEEYPHISDLNEGEGDRLVMKGFNQ